MNETLTEIIIVVALILMNGFFSGTEMALISLRKTRIKQLVKEGNKKAIIIEKLQENPEVFLATIQVGITLLSTIASTFAGANIAEKISPFLENSSWPFLAEHAETISFLAIVLAITYLSLIFGELVPKSLGLKFSERFSLFAARPIYWLSKISFFLTRLLTISSNFILKIFGDQTSFSETKLSEEELRAIIYEGHKSGVIKKYEHEILSNIFEFADIATAQIMTPRSKIFAVDIEDNPQANLRIIIEAGYSRIPFYKENIDNIIGILNIKDLLEEIGAEKKKLNFAPLLSPPYFIPNTQKISNLLRKFQKDKIHLAIVTNEHGETDGLITIEDILEEIVGEIDDEGDEENKSIKKSRDGTYLVEGSTSIVDFNRFLKSSLPEDDQFTTISGLILDKLEKFPKTGDKITIDNLEFTIKDKTDRLIKNVTVKKIAKKS